MADEREFAHIKVNPKVSCDEVVYAGAPQASEDAGDAACAREEACMSTLDGEDVSRAPSVSSPKAPAPRRAERYRATTMADLQDTRISLTQKLVIIAAIVLIIVAIVYYVVALR